MNYGLADRSSVLAGSCVVCCAASVPSAFYRGCCHVNNDDLASKGRCKEMFQYAGAQGWRLDAAPAAVPEVLLKWVCLPAVDDELGHKVLQYLASTGVEVLGYR